MYANRGQLDCNKLDLYLSTLCELCNELQCSYDVENVAQIFQPQVRSLIQFVFARLDYKTIETE